MTEKVRWGRGKNPGSHKGGQRVSEAERLLSGTKTNPTKGKFDYKAIYEELQETSEQWKPTKPVKPKPIEPVKVEPKPIEPKPEPVKPEPIKVESIEPEPILKPEPVIGCSDELWALIGGLDFDPYRNPVKK